MLDVDALYTFLRKQAEDDIERGVPATRLVIVRYVCGGSLRVRAELVEVAGPIVIFEDYGPRYGFDAPPICATCGRGRVASASFAME